jgi:7-cyano-7-deazaguanine synthase
VSRAIVLFSGGQDSTTCLFWARTYFDEVRALSIRYGQRHATEIAAAAHISGLADVPHDVIDVGALFAGLSDSALVTSAPLQASGGHDDVGASGGLPTSFVPGRNLLFLAIAGAYAVQHAAHDIVLGVCQTDYSGYPDCREAFIAAMQTTLNWAMPTSTGPFRVHAPLMNLTKVETVRLADRLPGCWDALAFAVTCYEGHRPGCGQCAACELRRKGFADADEIDPALWGRDLLK